VAGVEQTAHLLVLLGDLRAAEDGVCLTHEQNRRILGDRPDRAGHTAYVQAVAKAKKAARTPPGRWRLRWYGPDGSPKMKTLSRRVDADADAERSRVADKMDERRAMLLAKAQAETTLRLPARRGERKMSAWLRCHCQGVGRPSSAPAGSHVRCGL
jgi:hypothetical protein